MPCDVRKYLLCYLPVSREPESVYLTNWKHVLLGLMNHRQAENGGVDFRQSIRNPVNNLGHSLFRQRIAVDSSSIILSL